MGREAARKRKKSPLIGQPNAMLKKISPYLPALISSISILCSTFFTHTATRMLNDSLQEMNGSILPTPTIAALTCFKYYLIPSIAFFSLCIIGLVEWKVQERSRRLAIEVYLLSAFLFLNTLLFVAMALPFACFCCEIL
ncbi:MAG: hypothetical protein D3925_13160 [Candidatus Electrothrix sp. AR5]|nr:hypothetical protein [Candidatus Electrothrix sp. AR5]